ncbi:hypothetical protein GOBAR_AA13869 [Gossypium barbadense]|uniref:Major facilitator superfamily (MFS) profile domain-containing protein n=1 Tax=Gossypium barbadense TaxID=3634 RepID=A0A2P5XTU5_GOSBA|nr:hypothetical protein GOBAR_AA13869 [Gossypium barbadense]
MEKNEMLEGLVTRRPITDEAETSIIDGDSVISYNNHASTSVTITVIFSTIVAISGSYAFGNAVGYSSPAKSGIMKDLGLSLSEYAVFGSILTVGGMLGATCSGKIADLVGRRGVSLLLTVTYVKDAWYPVSCLMQAMGISEIFCITGWFAIVFSKDALWLDLGRLLVGCGSGVLCYVRSSQSSLIQIPLYLAEIAAKNVRGAFSSLTIAIVFETIWHENSLMCPIDTPNQLQAKTNETKEFEAALRRLRGEHADISQEATDIRFPCKGGHARHAKVVMLEEIAASSGAMAWASGKNLTSTIRMILVEPNSGKILSNREKRTGTINTYCVPLVCGSLRRGSFELCVGSELSTEPTSRNHPSGQGLCICRSTNAGRLYRATGSKEKFCHVCRPLYTEYIEQIPDEGLLNLFQKRYAYPLIVGAGLMMFQQFGGLNGFSYYASFIFESAGFPSTVGSIGVAVLQIFMAIIGVLFIDKSGRRPLLLDFHARKDLTATLVIIGVLVFLLSFELGMGGIPWIIVSEIFPLNIRGSGGSMVNLINWTSSWVVSYTFTFLFEWNSAGTFFILAFMGAVGTVFIGKLVPETKGRTLEELQTY